MIVVTSMQTAAGGEGSGPAKRTRASALFVLAAFCISTVASGMLFLPQSALALTVSPARIELVGDPGKTIEGEFILVNEQNEAKTFYSSFENFEAKGESGSPSFVAGTEGMATWIGAPAEVTLGPGEQRTIPFIVKIPANAEPGGHFSAVFWGTSPPQVGGGQVSVGAKIGILMLLRVSGDIKEEGGILEFTTANKSRFFTTLPVSLTYRFQNSGGDRINPIGKLVVKNTIGMKIDELSANPSEGNVLPHSIRKYDLIWGDPTDAPKGFFDAVKKQWSQFAIGRYTASINLAYGTEGKTATASYSFFVFPWQLILVIIAVIFIVLPAISKVVRSYNAWIIRKSK